MVIEQVKLDMVVEQLWLVARLVEQVELDMVVEQLWLMAMVVEQVELKPWWWNS